MATRSLPLSRSRLPLSRRALWMIAAAFGIGLVLFGLFLLDQRDNSQFFRPPVATDKPEFEPLPVPNEPDAAADAPGAVIAPPAPLPPPVPAPPPQPAPAPPVATTPLPPPVNPTPAGTRGGDAAPQPLSTPQPHYPATAARNGEGGDVLLRLHVDANGEVEAVDLVSGSGSRDLDRAAIQAVRRWTFRPALRGGQPVPGEVKVPIRFTPPTD